ncbi:MAG: hypothetical protein M1469_08085 [Bacteroidetes bacterium]|nr:hypothetical protein [Bacteroidota bacterium]
MEKKTHVIIASLVLSILVWLSVSMNNEYSVAIRVPFKVSGLPDNTALASPIPKSILVRVRGTGWQLASAYLSTTSSINIDLSNFNKRRIVITSRDLGYSLDFGSSANIISFTPDTVVMTLDKIATKKVPIIPEIDVEPRSGFMVVGIPVLSPDSVTVIGSSDIVSKLDAWYTQPRRFKRVMNGITTTIPLSDTLTGILSLGTKYVDVSVSVQQIAEDTYKDIPIKILNNSDSANILLLPPTVDVTLRGGITTMSEISADSLSVTVNYDDLIHSSSSRVQPEVKAPPTLQVIFVKPDSVEFVIRK